MLEWCGPSIQKNYYPCQKVIQWGDTLGTLHRGHTERRRRRHLGEHKLPVKAKMGISIKEAIKEGQRSTRALGASFRRSLLQAPLTVQAPWPPKPRSTPISDVGPLSQQLQ